MATSSIHAFGRIKVGVRAKELIPGPYSVLALYLVSEGSLVPFRGEVPHPPLVARGGGVLVQGVARHVHGPGGYDHLVPGVLCQHNCV